jgi:hypothetical protein
MTPAHAGQKSPLSPPNVQQPSVSSEGVGVEHLLGDQGLRSGHEGGIGGDVFRSQGTRIGRLGVRPVPVKSSVGTGSVPHEFDGVAQVVIEEDIVLHQLRYGHVPNQRCAEGAQREGTTPFLPEEPKRDPCPQETEQAVVRNRRELGEFGG